MFRQRKTQEARILELRLRLSGAWVPSPDRLAVGIAEGKAGIFALPRATFRVENRTETLSAQGLSWFRLVCHPDQTVQAPADEDPAPSLFPDYNEAFSDLTADRKELRRQSARPRVCR